MYEWYYKKTCVLPDTSHAFLMLEFHKTAYIGLRLFDIWVGNLKTNCEVIDY